MPKKANTPTEQPDETPAAAAQGIAETLQSVFGIAEIVSVDDQYHTASMSGWPIEPFLGWLNAALADNMPALGAIMPGIGFDGRPERWRSQVAERWSGLDDAARTSWIEAVAEIAGTNPYEQYSPANAITRALPRAQLLRPSEWKARRQELLVAATPDKPLLCLFDQDLSDEEGFTEEGPNSGMGLILGLKEEIREGRVVCGLLSHKYPIEREEEEWKRLEEKTGLKLAEFLPLSKERLARPELFEAGLRKTCLNMFCERMKESSIAALARAHEDATAYLRQIALADTNHMVLVKAAREGAWEGDTLVRIYQIFFRDAAKKHLLDEPTAGDFNGFVDKARLVGYGEPNTGGDSARLARWKIQHQEVFENSSLLNRSHTPLDVGDLFETTEATPRRFILLAQPCDLMVRGDGARGGGKIPFGTLVPVSIKTPKQWFRSVKENGEHPGEDTPESIKEAKERIMRYATIEHIDPESDKLGIADFSQAFLIYLPVLDLSVFQSDGACRLNPREETVPPQLHAPWRKRHGQLRQELQNLAAPDPPQAREAAQPGPTAAAVVQADWPQTVTVPDKDMTLSIDAAGFVSFPLRRTVRLRFPWAGRLLAEYQRWLAREGDLHPLD